MPKQIKRIWVTPQITQIDLVFDKEMSDNCKGSAHASAAHPICGVAAKNQNACWNSKTGDYIYTD